MMDASAHVVASGRQQLERLDVCGAHDGEVPAIERGDRRASQALDDGDHRRVHEAQREVGVRVEKPADALEVGRGEIGDDEAAALDVGEEGGERAARGPQQVLGLDEDRSGDHQRRPRLPEQRGAALVVRVARVDGRDDRAGVDYERQRSGS